MPRTLMKAKGRKELGSFLRVPSVVLDSSSFRSLSTKSKALILEIGARYNGHNNGNLAAPWSWMKHRGWKSKDTLQRALVELQHFGMIELTRQGGLHGPNLYAFTWMPIDACKTRLDVASTHVASGKWKADAEGDGDGGMIENKTPPPLSGHATPTIGEVVLNKSPRCPDHRGHKTK